MSGSYKDLKVWQNSLDLVTEVYELTRPNAGRSHLGERQHRRREGEVFRQGVRRISLPCKGSLLELETQALIARRLGYPDAAGGKALENHASEVAKILNGLIKALRKDRDSTPTDCLLENGRTNDQRKLSADNGRLTTKRGLSTED